MRSEMAVPACDMVEMRQRLERAKTAANDIETTIRAMHSAKVAAEETTARVTLELAAATDEVPSENLASRSRGSEVPTENVAAAYTPNVRLELSNC